MPQSPREKLDHFFQSWLLAPKDLLIKELDRMNRSLEKVDEVIKNVPDGHPQKEKLLEDRELIRREIGALEEILHQRRRYG